MLTDQDIQEAQEKEAASAALFYKGIVEFIKWTSTLAAAAILWIGTAIASSEGSARYLAGMGLVSLVISLVIAISVVYRVLTAWSNEWVANRAEHTLWLVKKLRSVEAVNVSDEEEKKYVEQLLSAIDNTKSFREPSSFNRRVVAHISLLTLGLLLYAAAQIVSSF